MSACYGFENVSAGIPVARAIRCVNDDIGVDEEQLLETPFYELVELIGGNVAGVPSDYRSIRLISAPLWHSTEMLVDCLSDKSSNRRIAPPCLVLETPPLVRSQKDLQPFAVHTHSIHTSDWSGMAKHRDRLWQGEELVLQCPFPA